jgi:delta-aminolevulinic acid dehydratase/porphobilinogen synthase
MHERVQILLHLQVVTSYHIVGVMRMLTSLSTDMMDGRVGAIRDILDENVRLFCEKCLTATR